MGVLGFLTCGACSSRRKRGHESFPDTITIPTPTHQQQEAAQQHQYQPHHHPYEIHGAAAGQNRRNTQQGDGRSSSNEGRRAPGERRPSNGQQRPRGNSRPQQYQQQQQQYPDPAQHQPRNRPPAHGRHDNRPVVRNIEPVAPEKVRQSGGSMNSSGNNRDSDITDKSREVATRVLQQFQSDPTLGRRRIPYSSFAMELLRIIQRMQNLL
ncbi:hypothetical protein PHYBOEH_008812 [Phytophthora boehmeriae]|uniref:Uncharacterized protein n=1 Tax=Phytophthora boehmeriae TaxID=109152 RepID=A0A8T1VXQ4_9STRA|nr:hypothetical protein PHYBOEH_008812 [Phytophthora boehmeriae]